MFRLYGFFTQNSLKTLYVLEEVVGDFEFIFVDLGKGEQKTEAFSQMTPVGKVPVLVMHEERQEYGNSYAVMRLKDLRYLVGD